MCTQREEHTATTHSAFYYSGFLLVIKCETGGKYNIHSSEVLNCQLIENRGEFNRFGHISACLLQCEALDFHMSVKEEEHTK